MNYSFDLSRNQMAFVRSQADIVALIGPQGEGKTFAGGARIISRAAQMPKGEILRGAIIRDTGPNLEQHTIVSLRKAFGAFTGFKTLRSGGWMWYGPKFEAIMFGIDHLNSLSRLQGLEPDFLWLEEPAPIINGPSAGLSKEVFSVGFSRLWRDESRSKFKWLQATMNPGDEEHWSFNVLLENPLPNTEVFSMVRGENKFQSESEREKVRSAFRDRPDLLARYDRGEWGSVKTGEAVTPEYREELHLADTKLDPISGLTHCFRFWDGWHNPSVIFAQRSPRGRVLVLDVIRGENMGVRQLIRSQVKALVSTRYGSIKEWEDYGDESMATPDQSNREESAAKAVEGELSTTFRGVSNDWNMRREGMKNLLGATVDADRMLLVSPHEKILNKALRGGWHYPKSASGIVGDKPVKDLHSHPGDCFSYLAVTLMGNASAKWPIPDMSRMKKRAASYGVKR